MKSEKRVIRGKGWTRSIKISKEKFDPIAKAILKVLSSKPMRFSELSWEIKEKLPSFSGSIEWYTITVLRELESQGKVKRIKGRIVTYEKV